MLQESLNNDEDKMTSEHIKYAQRMIKIAEKYKPFFQKYRESGYNRIGDLIDWLMFLYPVEKLWVIENTYGIIIKAIVILPEYRNRGIGTKILNELIDYADSIGKLLAVTPSRKYGGSVSRLTDWFKNFGFVMNTGKKRNFKIAETMIRYPEKPGLKQKLIK